MEARGSVRKELTKPPPQTTENAKDLKHKRDEMDNTDDSGVEERRRRGTVVEVVGKQVVKDTEKEVVEKKVGKQVGK